MGASHLQPQFIPQHQYAVQQAPQSHNAATPPLFIGDPGNPPQLAASAISAFAAQQLPSEGPPQTSSSNATNRRIPRASPSGSSGSGIQHTHASGGNLASSSLQASALPRGVIFCPKFIAPQKPARLPLDVMGDGDPGGRFSVPPIHSVMSGVYDTQASRQETLGMQGLNPGSRVGSEGGSATKLLALSEGAGDGSQSQQLEGDGFDRAMAPAGAMPMWGSRVTAAAANYLLDKHNE